MNRFFTIILLAVFFGTALYAQSVPQGFNYQTVIRDANGNAYANQTVTLLFSIRNGAANGPISYTERHIVNTNEYGLVNLVIGQGTVLQGDFNTINWGGGPKYLTASVETSPNVFDELGSTQLMSVPYALFALNGGGGGGGGDNWGSQTAQTDYSLKGSGTVGDPLGLSPQEAQPGQVLKWDGTKWTPQDDIANTGTNGGTITQINTNSGIVGGPITTTGTIGLSNTGVTPGTYGSATQIPVVTVDAQGRVSNVFTVVPSPGTIGINGGTGIAVQQNGTSFTITNIGDTNAGDDLTNASQANGDVTGPFSNLQIAAGVVGNTELANNAVNTANIVNGAITAAKLNSMSATTGQVLKWNGTAWAPAADQGGGASYVAGTGISITGVAPNQTINNTGDTNAADDITNTSTSGGDVSGTFTNLQIVANAVGTNEIANGSIATADLGDQAVTGAKIDDMGATSGQVLKWNGTTWAPATDNTGSGNITINAGNGIAVFGGGSTFTISNEGDVDPLDDVTNLSQAGGDLSGVFSNLQLKTGVVGINELANNSVASNNIINNSIVAADLNNMGATNGQVLAYNGSAWAPTTLSGGGAGDNWGTQTAQTNATLSGNGTQVSPLGIAAQGAANGQVLKYTGVTWVPEDDTWGTQVVIANPTLAGNGTAVNPLRIAAQGATMGQVLQYTGSTWAPASISGDNWGAQTAETDVTLDGDGTVANPLKIAKQGAVDGQVLQFNGTNWVPANVSGDDWGAQVAESDATLDGDGSAASPLKIAAQGATNGQILKYTGLTWVPANDTWGSQVVVANATLSGNGTAGSPLRIAAQGATNGQVLKWNGSSWSPADDIVGTGGGTGNTYLAGTGINITGTGPNFTINNTGDLDGTNELQTLSLAGSALTLSNGGGTVNIPAGNNYIAGTAISITGSAPNFTINNTGDPSSTNEIQALSLVGNNLSLSNGGGSVSIDPSSTNEIQSLSLAGNALTLSNGGGTVNLPSGNNYTAGTGISITGSAPNFTITNTGDPSSTNELQNLSLNGSTLKITGTNSTVKLDTLLMSGGLGLWKNNGNNIFNNNTGNVGINTNNPSTKLHVKGGGETVRIEGADPMISFSGAASGIDGYLWQRNGNLILGTQDSSNVILQTGNFSPALVVGGVTGNVIIGGPAPGDEKLKVVHSSGGFMLENTNGNNWEFFVQEGTGNLVLYTNPLGPSVPVGAFAPNGVYMSSDKKLKKEIVGLPSVLDKLNKLEPVSYKFNFQSEKDSESYGFLAQDVQTLFPNMVSTNPGRKDQPSSLMVNYSGLGVIAIKAIQEQQAQITQLKSENAELRTRLDAIEAKLNK